MSDEDHRGPQAFDPRGYWSALGVGPLASGAEIAAAFKAKIRNLHPDNDPSEHAAREFLIATEAYRVLKQRQGRLNYVAESGWRAPDRAPGPDDPASDPLTCWRCGKVTAQPRYLIFHRVIGLGWTAGRRRIAGIFCRDCADRTAVKASTLTWLLGWWSLGGPFLTMAALCRNAAGGTRPAAENFRSLLHQARVFLDLDRADAVRSLAGQARGYAATAGERDLAERYLARVGHEGAKLRDRWRGWSGVALIQGMSIAAILFAGLTGAAMLTLRGSTDAVSAPIVLERVKPGEIRYVAVDALELRDAPSRNGTILALLDRFTTIRVLDADADGLWAHLSIPNGATGFAEARYLFGGSGERPRALWCAGHRGDAPSNGEVLMRRTGGDHALAAVNATGRDVLVRLKSAGGDTVVSFYLAAGGAATIADIPDGSFGVMFATGRDYSRACEAFTSDMQAFRVPAQQMTLAEGRAPPRLTLLAPGDGANKPQPAPLANFTDH